MRTNTMNARLILASTTVVLATMGTVEMLRPAQAQAVGKQVAAARAQVANALSLSTGINLDPAFKSKVVAQLKTTVKDSAKQQSVLTFLEQVDTGSPVPGQKSEQQSYDQLLLDARKDVAKLKSTGGKFTSDLDEYLAHKDKDVYLPMPKTAEQLNRVWGGGIVTPPPNWQWPQWIADLSVKSIQQDWIAVATQVAGLTLPGQLFSPAYAMFLAAQEQDWISFSLALLSLHNVVLGVIAGGAAIAVGVVLMAVGMIWTMVKAIISQPSYQELVGQFRAGRDEAWKKTLEEHLKDAVVPHLESAWKQAQQDGAYGTALAEAVLDAHIAQVGQTDKDALRKGKEDLRENLTGELGKFASEARTKFPDMAVDAVKEFATNTDASRRKKLSDTLPGLSEGGITQVDSVVPTNGNWGGIADYFWLFSGDKVAQIYSGDNGRVAMTEKPVPISQSKFKGVLEEGRAGSRITGWATTNRGDQRDQVFLFTQKPGEAPKYVRVNIGSGAVQESGWVSARFGTSAIEPQVTAPAGATGTGYNRILVLDGKGAKQLWTTGTAPGVAAHLDAQQLPGLNGLGFTGMTALLPVRNSSSYYVFYNNGEVARTILSRQANGQASPFNAFTDAYLDSLPLDRFSQAGQHALDVRDNVKRDLFQDKAKDRLPGDDRLRSLVTPTEIKPIAVPPLGSVADGVYSIHTTGPLNPGVVRRIAGNRLDVALSGGGAAMNWQMEDVGGRYRIRVADSPQYCLAGSSHNQEVFTYACNTNEDQLWTFEPAASGDGHVRIVNVRHGTALTRPGPAGNLIGTTQTANETDRTWTLRKVSTRGSAGDEEAGPAVSVNGFGDDYTAEPGGILGKGGSEGLKARVLRDGKNAEGVEVEFSVPEGSGLYFEHERQHVTKVKVTTDDNGEATAPVLHAGDKEGDFKVTMTAVGEPHATPGVYTVHVQP